MYIKKIFAAVLAASVIASAAPAPRAEAFIGAGEAWDYAAEYIGASSIPELISHFSAFTGIVYWLFSGTANFVWNIGGDGFGNIVPDLYDRFKGRPGFDKNAPGTFSL